MYKILTFLFLIYSLSGINSLIVPDDVPTVLSLVYSILPPIKKGTDSRLGWGFRLGNHADFQVLLELGPQTETRPLGNENKNNKRYVENNLRNTLYAQNQILKTQQQISNTDGGKWLQSWSNMMKQSTKIQEQPVEGIGEVDASQVIPAELEELYGKSNAKKTIKPKTTTTERTTIKFETTSPNIQSTTDEKDALDNVEME